MIAETLQDQLNDDDLPDPIKLTAMKGIANAPRDPWVECAPEDVVYITTAGQHQAAHRLD